MTSNEFVKRSLALHLFFGRIMKEHSFFLEVAFTPRDANYISKADSFRKAFDSLLEKAIILSNGIVSEKVLQSGEVVTPYTLQAERLSSFYTGVRIPTRLTQAEFGLCGDYRKAGSRIVEKVKDLNNEAIKLTNSLIEFKAKILSNVLSCRMFTLNYPLLIDHIMREAKLYVSLLQKLQRMEDMNLEKEAYQQESFWNRIMAEHSKFIRGLLDPTEMSSSTRQTISEKNLTSLRKMLCRRWTKPCRTTSRQEVWTRQRGFGISTQREQEDCSAAKLSRLSFHCWVTTSCVNRTTTCAF